MYITEKFYKENGGKAEENDSSALRALISQASLIIDNMTMNKIADIGFNKLTVFQQKSIKKACVHIVDYIASHNPGGAELASYWAGDIRINLNKNAPKKPWDAYNCGLWGYMNILQTGLMRSAI